MARNFARWIYTETQDRGEYTVYTYHFDQKKLDVVTNTIVGDNSCVGGLNTFIVDDFYIRNDNTLTCQSKFGHGILFINDHSFPDDVMEDIMAALKKIVKWQTGDWKCSYNFDSFQFKIVDVLECDIRNVEIELVCLRDGLGTLKIDRPLVPLVPKEVVLHILDNRKK